MGLIERFYAEGAIPLLLQAKNDTLAAT